MAEDRCVAVQGLSHPFPGGMARYTEDLAAHLARTKGIARVEYLAWSSPFPRALYRGPPPVSDAAPERPANVRLHPLLSYASLLSWIRAGRIARGTDLLHLQVNSQLHLVAQSVLNRVARRPLVTTFHNARPHDGHEPYLEPLMKWMARRSDAIVVHNDQVAERLGQALGVPPRRFHVLPHPVYDGVDRGRWDKASARERLRLAPDRFVFLFLGAVREYKGVRPLVEAMRDVPGADLVVAGQCWDHQAEIEAMAAHSDVRGRVHLRLGYVPDDDLELYYKAADAAVFPYVSMQGDSGALRMAQSFRLPLVVSDALPHPNGAAAVAARSGFPGTLAQAMRDAMAGGPPSRPATDVITWTTFARRCVEIYEGVLTVKGDG